MSGEPEIAVGKITRAHGVRGEVAVLVLSEVEERFIPGSVLGAEGRSPVTIETTRRDRGRLLIKFLDVDDRVAAQSLQGVYLTIPRSASPELPAGSYWPYELEGCAVRTEAGRELGTIAEVIHTQANDVWAARSAATDDSDSVEVLIPALRDVVISVDVGAREVVVRDVPGLTIEEE
ncbi:MAG: ribosome maturation factor RimM [Actinomycetota bacterium]|nr:ribosome maturation factor RimM [Actinomycetota bacterium]